MSRALRLVAVLLALAGCRAPEPFDPAADCPKEANCGQCASRGACAWCGDPGGSAGGQCLAVGHSDCPAPGGWSRTPDRCPAPPPDDNLTAAGAASSKDAPVEEKIGKERYATIRTALVRAFPDAKVDDSVVDGVAEILLRAHVAQAASGPRDAEGREVAPVTRHVVEKAHPLYLGYATHHRVKGIPPASRPMQSEFTLALPMVRVRLPETLREGATVIDTELGDVDLGRDHLLGSVDLVADKYGGKGYLGRRPARVDLITPARGLGARFGAIAVYLGYFDKADRGPSFYLLEAGTATGDAKMIYFSPSMKPIESVTSYYLPTPFVSMKNTYSGGITMRPPPDQDEPDTLIIESRAPGEKDPYITVTLRYRRVAEMDLPAPIELTIDAAARVAVLANTMGLASAEDLQPVLARLGETLHWQEVPRYVAPSTAGTATPAAPAAPADTAGPAGAASPPDATAAPGAPPRP